MRCSSRTPALLMLALLSGLILSGCTGGSDAGEGDEEGEEGQWRDPGLHVEGIGSDFVVLMNPVDAHDCRSVEVQVEVTESHASSLLPEGFQPAVGPFGMNAALVVEVHACEGSASEEQEAGYARAWVGVLVESPTLPGPAAGFQRENRTKPEDADQAVELYVLAAYINGQGFQRFLRQSGIPFLQAWVDLEFHGKVEGLLDALVVQVYAEDREEGEEVLRMAASLATSTDSTMHRTAWAVSRHGVQAFEELHSGPAGAPVRMHEGTGVCLVPQESLLAEPFGPQGCASGWVRASASFEVTGHSLWFHDTRILK